MEKKIKPTKDLLISTIEPMIDEIQSTIIRINSGGCGIFALLFYMGLESKYKDIEICCYDDWEDINYKKDNINDVIKNGYDRWSSYYFSCSHVVVRVGKWYIDGETIMDKRQWKKEVKSDGGNEGTFTKEELIISLKLGRENYQWNSNYRRGQNSKLKKIIEHHTETKIKLPVSIHKL